MGNHSSNSKQGTKRGVTVNPAGINGTFDFSSGLHPEPNPNLRDSWKKRRGSKGLLDASEGEPENRLSASGKMMLERIPSRATMAGLLPDYQHRMDQKQNSRQYKIFREEIQRCIILKRIPRDTDLEDYNEALIELFRAIPDGIFAIRFFMFEDQINALIQFNTYTGMAGLWIDNYTKAPANICIKQFIEIRYSDPEGQFENHLAALEKLPIGTLAFGKQLPPIPTAPTGTQTTTGASASPITATNVVSASTTAPNANANPNASVSVAETNTNLATTTATTTAPTTLTKSSELANPTAGKPRLRPGSLVMNTNSNSSPISNSNASTNTNAASSTATTPSANPNLNKSAEIPNNPSARRLLPTKRNATFEYTPKGTVSVSKDVYERSMKEKDEKIEKLMLVVLKLEELSNRHIVPYLSDESFQDVRTGPTDEELMQQLLEEDRQTIEKELAAKRYDCSICFDEYPIDNIFILDGCNHRYCRKCLEEWCASKIVEADVASINCPNRECEQVLSYSEVLLILTDKQVAKKYETFVLNHTLGILSRVCLSNLLENLGGELIWCPKVGCGDALIAETNSLMIRCQNSSCKFCFCRKCRIQWHVDMTCEQYKSYCDESRRKTEQAVRDEQLFSDWVKANAKPCPGCKGSIEKNQGCNHMTCVKCKHQFCWLCLATYAPDHWTTNTTGCKQFT